MNDQDKTVREGAVEALLNYSTTSPLSAETVAFIKAEFAKLREENERKDAEIAALTKRLKALDGLEISHGEVSYE